MSSPSTVDQPMMLASSRSTRFYYEVVVFEIEGTLYRIPKQGLVNHSHSFFRELFSLPQGSGDCREGESDARPIRPPQVTKDEFESLLEVLYPLELTGPPGLSKKQWTGILRLSRQWGMPGIAALAIKKLDSLELSSIEKVQLGRAHGVPQWVKDGYTSLVGDISIASFEELKGLGLETASRILYAQIQLHIVTRRDDLVCGYCLRYRRTRYKVDCRDSSEGPIYTCSGYGCSPQTSGNGAYCYVDLSVPNLPDRSSVADRVAEMFKDDIEEAENQDNQQETNGATS